MTASAKKLLTAELQKLTPSARDAALMILEDFECLSKELQKLRNVMTLAAIQCDLPGEEWRDIEGFEGIYQVSNKGRVKSLYFGRELILKPSIDSSKYPHVTLSKGKDRTIARIHILVAKAFIPNPENKPEVNHINGDKLDCRVENLEWVTKSENQQHAAEMGLKPCGTKSYNAKFTEEEIRDIRENCILGSKEYGINAFARKYKVRKSVIGNIVHGQTYKNVK